MTCPLVAFALVSAFPLAASLKIRDVYLFQACASMLLVCFTMTTSRCQTPDALLRTDCKCNIDLSLMRIVRNTGFSSIKMSPRQCAMSCAEPKARWYHAAFHTIAAMVGAGVLALPYSFSYLTWGGGATCLAACTALSLYCSHLLAGFHEKQDGSRINRYRDLGRHVLGSPPPPPPPFSLYGVSLHAIALTNDK